VKTTPVPQCLAMSLPKAIQELAGIVGSLVRPTFLYSFFFCFAWAQKESAVTCLWIVFSRLRSGRVRGQEISQPSEIVSEYRMGRRVLSRTHGSGALLSVSTSSLWHAL
jgi:hypothetical protein